MTPTPVAVSWLICDQAIFEERTHKVSPINTFRGVVIERFPHLAPPFSVLAILTDGRGYNRVDGHLSGYCNREPSVGSPNPLSGPESRNRRCATESYESVYLLIDGPVDYTVRPRDPAIPKIDPELWKLMQEELERLKKRPHPKNKDDECQL